MAAEYVRSADQSFANYPQPFENPWSMPMEGPHRQSLGRSSLRRSTCSTHSGFCSTRTSSDQRNPDLDHNIDRSHRRQSLQPSSDRRASLTAEIDNRLRRSSLPNPVPNDSKPQKKRIVGNGIYKPETLPWHESSLRQAIARQTQNRKGQLASPLPLINLRPEAEARLSDVLGEENYAEWRRKHRASYLLNEG